MRTNLRKLESIVEVVRHGLEGDAALEFVHQAGYPLSPGGLARHLRTLGGWGRVQELANAGKSNREILEECLPKEDFSSLNYVQSQADLFGDTDGGGDSVQEVPDGSFETTKMTVKVPTDLYQALRIAAKAEKTSIGQLVTDILSSALSRMP